MTKKSLIPWRRLLLEKMTVAQLVKKFPAIEPESLLLHHWTLS
jgi:hypothetical protein